MTIIFHYITHFVAEFIRKKYLNLYPNGRDKLMKTCPDVEDLITQCHQGQFKCDEMLC